MVSRQLWRFMKRFLSPPIFQISNQQTKVGDIFQLQAGYLDQSSSELLLITRPFAKSLLVDTLVDSVSVSPLARNIDGNFIKYGGKGTAPR